MIDKFVLKKTSAFLVLLLLGCGTGDGLYGHLKNRLKPSGSDDQLPIDPGSGDNGNDKDEELVITDPIAAGLEVFNKSKMQEELTYITRDEFNGRLSATDGNVKIADWIIGHLNDLQVEPLQSNEYRQKFKMKNGPTSGKETSNIIAHFPGNDPNLKNEYVIIGAHMDHAGTLSLGYTCSSGSGGNNICNGADDNGSGTISVLNITKALAKVRKHIKRTIIVMWFSGEEEGLEGSWHYTKNPIVSLEKTVYMINLDMVGYMKSYGNKLAALGGGTSDRGEEILKAIQDRYPERKLQITQSAGGGSDHVPFMSKGIPGVFFHTGVSNNPNYHRTSDTPDKIDYEGMLIAAKIAFETVFNVANDENLHSGFYGERASLVTEEEKKQSCHHLILNPYIDKAYEIIRDGLY